MRIWVGTGPDANKLASIMVIDREPPATTTAQEDVRALIKVLHQDRQNAKDKEQRESWTKYVSLMVVVLAVATGIGSLKSAAYASRVMLNQAQASDTWAFYQAKSIKQKLVEMEVLFFV
jgi:hypothetical protein